MILVLLVPVSVGGRADHHLDETPVSDLIPPANPAEHEAAAVAVEVVRPNFQQSPWKKTTEDLRRKG